MSYVYPDVENLDQTPLVGSKQCAVLVQHYAKAPVTTAWTEGDKVLGNLTLPKGTAIATFVNGKYPNGQHGNHAAFYVGQNAGGIWVVDQWAGDPKKPLVSKRYVIAKGKLKSGSYVDPSNNADAFSVIE